MLVSVIGEVLKFEAETIEEFPRRAVGFGFPRDRCVVWFVVRREFPLFRAAFIYRLIMLPI